jgi:glycosyltransferase involved in cell wall biosynthesis
VSGRRVIQRIEFVPDEETELYFKAADVLALPYRDASESGVLVLGYAFGLPVIATDVGSFRQNIVEGETGFLCKPSDADDLARTIETYFRSSAFTNLERRRREIQDYASAQRSWDTVGAKTLSVYSRLAPTDTRR